MTRLIDADAFDAIINDDGTIDEYATETARNAMLIMPTVDAVPVVLIEQEIERLDGLAEYELNELGELGEAFYGSCALSQLLKKWAERKEE